jgi:hypothetical protein
MEPVILELAANGETRLERNPHVPRLRAAVAFHRAGKLPPGSFVKFYFFGGRNYFDYGGDRVPTNVALLDEVVGLCREMGRPPATGREAAAILGLP